MKVSDVLGGFLLTILGTIATSVAGSGYTRASRGTVAARS